MQRSVGFHGGAQLFVLVLGLGEGMGLHVRTDANEHDVTVLRMGRSLKFFYVSLS